MKVVGMIPARLESSRLPRKALIDIAGLPMVVHTCKRAQLAKNLDEVYLATDSLEIKKVAESFDIKVIMTASHHPSGSDRIAEAADKVESDIIVNIQGDEPLVKPDHIDKIAQAILDAPSVNVALGVTEYTQKNRTSDIKAVLDLNDHIMYCSRTDLPSDARTPIPILLKMCFVVAFRTEFLLQYSNWEPTPLEMVEYNEYLRILEHGFKIKAVRIADAKISVDTFEDLKIIRSIVKDDSLFHTYI